jgi:hypothetical protein
MPRSYYNGRLPQTAKPQVLCISQAAKSLTEQHLPLFGLIVVALFAFSIG